MSREFIRKFKNEHKCPCCAADKKSGYSLCPKHLEMCRARWEAWAIERRAQGLCCYCDCKSFRGWLRCRKHAEINRRRCRAWMRRHPNRGHELWEQRKALYRDKGLCVACKPHRKNAPGHTRCEVCVFRQKLYGKMPVDSIRAAVRAMFGTDA